MRKLDALNNLYLRPPLNEHIERDFSKALQDALPALDELHRYLSALHQDGLLKHLGQYGLPADAVLKQMDWIIGWIAYQGEYGELHLPPDCPEDIAAETAYAERAAADQEAIARASVA
jgi:hypothetical protein